MKKIFFTRKLIKKSEKCASSLFTVKLNNEDSLLSNEEIINQSNDCDGIISTITEIFNEEVISKFSNL